MWMVFRSVSLLLFIACTSIVPILLSRWAQRQHEISGRFSLGAPRGALIPQLLTETFFLALIGSGLGLFLAAAASDIFRPLPAQLPRVEEINLDAHIVLHSLACWLGVTLHSGLLPSVLLTIPQLPPPLATPS